MRSIPDSDVRQALTRPQVLVDVAELEKLRADSAQMQLELAAWEKGGRYRVKLDEMVRITTDLREAYDAARAALEIAAQRTEKRVCRTCRLPVGACDRNGERTRHSTCQRAAADAREIRRMLAELPVGQEQEQTQEADRV